MGISGMVGVMRPLPLLVWALCLASLPSRLAAAQPPSLQDFTPVRRVEVVDATDTLLGEAHILGLADIVVLLSVNDGAEIVAVPVEPPGFPYSLFGLGFTTSDCTGQGYLLDIHRVEEHWLPLGIITGPGHTLWVRAPGAAPEAVTLHSVLETGCVGFYYPDIWTLRARALVDLDSVYTPPFRLRVGQRPPRR